MSNHTQLQQYSDSGCLWSYFPIFIQEPVVSVWGCDLLVTCSDFVAHLCSQISSLPLDFSSNISKSDNQQEARCSMDQWMQACSRDFFSSQLGSSVITCQAFINALNSKDKDSFWSNVKEKFTLLLTSVSSNVVELGLLFCLRSLAEMCQYENICIIWIIKDSLKPTKPGIQEKHALFFFLN